MSSKYYAHFAQASMCQEICYILKNTKAHSSNNTADMIYSADEHQHLEYTQLI